jgi:hypothetical protein
VHTSKFNRCEIEVTPKCDRSGIEVHFAACGPSEWRGAEGATIERCVPLFPAVLVKRQLLCLELSPGADIPDVACCVGGQKSGTGVNSK